MQSSASTTEQRPFYPGSDVESLLQCKFDWFVTSSVGNDHNIIIHNKFRGEGTANSDVHSTKFENKHLDLSQSADWMEYIETLEGRENDVGGAGAYDTMRCDLILSQPLPLLLSTNSSTTSTSLSSQFQNSSTRRRIWGEEYHLNRLTESYKSLMQASKSDISIIHLDDAIMKSKAMLQRLLLEAETTPSLTLLQTDATLSQDTIVQLLRLTLLWSPPNQRSRKDSSVNGSQIIVRGHACCTAKPIRVHASPDPIVASLAIKPSEKQDVDLLSDAIIDNSLPTRHKHPQSKIASWCRLRKTMEGPTTFKPPGTSEVLMVRKRIDVIDDSERLEVLEGLSSNFFVIDKSGSLRTAIDGVLCGYVRHLVMHSASKCGLKFDPRPIFLHEMDHWQEAFITSSSRLIYPISRIIIPQDRQYDIQPDNQTGIPNGAVEYETTNFVEYWTDPLHYSAGDMQNSSNQPTPKWKELLSEILKEGGYPPYPP